MSKRILLADDSLTIQKVVELTFMDEDFEVEAVGSGDEALARLSGALPNILIADVHMPGASGYEVCRLAKAMSANLPVLLLVGTFEALDEDEMVACGADGNLKKPFDSQELLQVVRRMTSGEPPSRSQAPAGDKIEGFEGTAFEETSDEEAGAEEPPELPVTGFDLAGGGLDEELGRTPPELPVTGFGSDAADLEGEPEIEPVDLGDSADYRQETVEGASGNETVFIEAQPASSTDEQTEAPEQEPEIAAETVELSVEEPTNDEPEQVSEPVSPGTGELSEADVDRVARRVVEMMSNDTVREVAWDVIPDMAEIVIKDRIRELESETD